MTILVIDVGSSSVRALVFDEAANPQALVQRKHQMITDQNGAAYFEVQPLQANIEACLDEILQHPLAQDIQAVGMDTFVGNVIGINALGKAITPLFTYAESRAVDDLETLRPFYEATDTHQRTGCPHHTAYLPSQLHWYQRTQNQPVHQWLDLGSFLYRQWFGKEVPISYSAAAWSGLLNRRTLAWDESWLAELGLSPQQVAPLADYTTFQQGLSDKRWSQLANVPFYLAVGDGAAANVGVGAIDESAIALTVGTTAALRVITTAENPPVPEGLWSYLVDAKHHLIGGATSEGGNIFQWVSQQFQLPDDAEAHIQNCLPDAHGLTFLPLLAGERAPGWAADATGSILGLRLNTSAVDVLQAALEGVAIRLATIFHSLPKAEHIKVFASGGALANSQVWTQIIADAFGCGIHLVTAEETTARGTAILTLAALHNFDLNHFEPPTAQVIHPRLEHTEILRQAAQRQTDYYRQLVASQAVISFRTR